MKLMNQRRHGWLRGAALAAATLLAGCEVTNPGPIPADFLTDESAQQGLIFGAQRSIAEIIGGRVLEMAYMAREVFPASKASCATCN